ncbi:hypothetical protein D9M69_530380 [compost metagenome]
MVGGTYRGCEDHPLDARVVRRKEHPQSALTGGLDQSVRIFRKLRRKGRRGMNDITTAFDSCRPAIVAIKICLHEAEPLQSILANMSAKQTSHAVTFFDVAQTTAHTIAFLKQLKSDVPGEKPTNAGNQHRCICSVRLFFHRMSF